MDLSISEFLKVGFGFGHSEENVCVCVWGVRPWGQLLLQSTSVVIAAVECMCHGVTEESSPFPDPVLLALSVPATLAFSQPLSLPTSFLPLGLCT